jgi:hypothetical protein
VERFVLVVVLVAVAVAVALVLERRRPDPPTQTRYAVPSQLDRADFPQPDVRWLVAVFTSRTCDACAGVLAKASVLGSDHVAVVEVEASAHAGIHARYDIDAVPMTVVADDEGVVRAAFIGTPSATDLWAAVAEVRDPGTSPEPELGQLNRDPPPVSPN